MGFKLFWWSRFIWYAWCVYMFVSVNKSILTLEVGIIPFQMTILKCKRGSVVATVLVPKWNLLELDGVAPFLGRCSLLSMNDTCS